MSEINEWTQSFPESILNITTRIVYKKGEYSEWAKLTNEPSPSPNQSSR